jgi:hypothetical protein
MSGPNCRPTPRLLGPRPGLGWGSVQSISFTRPSLAGWRLACLSILRISSNVTPSFEKRPPCRTRYLLPTNVANGRALNVSENILNTRSLYLMLVELEVLREVTLLDILLRSHTFCSCRLFRGCHG